MNGTQRYNWNGSDLLEAGEYAQSPFDGTWHAETPNGQLANLSAHQVVEHPDGTITVTPSIKVSNHEAELWHGYLTAGVWKSC